MNSKTELVERRLINFELFFQTVALHKQVKNVVQFLRLKPSGEPKKKVPFSLYFPDQKKLKININEDTMCVEIIRTLNRKYPTCFNDTSSYAIVFLHHKHGEKILDEFECPLQLLENFQEKLMGSLSAKLFSRQVTNKEGGSLLKYFDPKASSAFYIKRFYWSLTIMEPDPWTDD